MAGMMSSDSESEDTSAGSKLPLTLDNWITFALDQPSASLLLNLRLKWHAMFLRRMTTPNKPPSQSDEV